MQTKMNKVKVGVLGATGMVGRTYISLLENHPWFEVGFVAASERSAGKTYAEAVNGRWPIKKPIPAAVKNLVVQPVSAIGEAKKHCSFVFSAMDTEAARQYEELYAAAGFPVISNASAHRYTRDVPMLIPEINPEHADIIPIQQKNRNWKTGFIAVKPNCSIQSYIAPLFALHKDFKVDKVVVTTMQAISGGGHSSFGTIDIEDNIIPFISGEEEKSEREPLKIFGSVQGTEIKYGSGPAISAHCNRVPVMDGHMACVSVKFERKPTREQIIKAWESFRGVPQELQLPSAPKQPIIYEDAVDRPQTRYDRDNENGMAVTVGRLRECNILDYRFVGVSHNMIRGAAGGSILTAELLKSRGLIG